MVRVVRVVRVVGAVGAVIEAMFEVNVLDIVIVGDGDILVPTVGV